MKPPSKFEIMRINRGFGEFVNDKHRLLCSIDCAELHVLRTLRKGETEDAYPKADALHETTVPPAGYGLNVPATPPIGRAQPPVRIDYRVAPAKRPWWQFWRPVCT
jgi:hypothetical protein